MAKRVSQHLLSLEELNQKEEFQHQKKLGNDLLENSSVKLFRALKYHDRLKRGAKRLQQREPPSSRK
jgi:hypothetical protein